MKIEKKILPKGQVELVVEMAADELQPYLVIAAEQICETKPIKGFRPGKAPYQTVVQTYGEMLVFQTAANAAIDASWYNAVEQEKLEMIDEPKIEVIKLAPGNPFIYKITLTLVPEIKVCDFAKISIKKSEKATIEPKELEKVLMDLQKIRAKDVETEATAAKGDKVDMNFNVFMDSVPIEGGQANNHSLTVGEGYMIPGFEEQVIGMKAGEEKEFNLNFPKEYHEKRLAGKEATFKIKINKVFNIQLPELNDEFAKELGMKDLEGLKKNISDNLLREKEMKNTQKQELEIIEKLLEESTFGEIPDSLVDAETHKMVHELEDNLASQGLNITDYLSHIKKTEAELRLDFTNDAIKRVKTGLLIRQIAIQEKIEATHDEIHEELDRTLASYKLNPAYSAQVEQLEQNLHSEHAHHYFGNLVRNRKTIDRIKQAVIKE